MTLRRALEMSRNLATANLLQGGIDITPALSLDRICALAMEAQIYRECMRYYPFVLGAQPVRPIDLAAFFAAIANEGVRPTPHVIESIEQDGKVIYRHPADVRGADRVGRRRRLLPAQDDPAGRPAARHRHPHRRARALCRRQDRHHRRRERRLVRRLHQRGHGGGLGRLRQCRRPAPHARRRRDRRQRRGADLRADHPGGVGAPCAAHDAARAVARDPQIPGRAAGRRRLRRRQPRLYGRRRRRANAGTLVEYLRRDARGQPVDTQYRLVCATRRSVHDPYAAGDRGRAASFGFFFGGGRGGIPRPGGQCASVGRRRIAAAMRRGRSRGRTQRPLVARGPRIDDIAWAWSRRPAGGAGAFSAACGRAGIRARRDAVGHRAAGRAIEAAVDRVLPTSRASDLVDPAVGFISYEVWAKARPVHRQFLSLYPGYTEPNVDVIVDGTKPPLSRAAAHVCGGGALRASRARRRRSTRAARDTAVRRADRSRHQAPARDRRRPGPPARAQGHP